MEYLQNMYPNSFIDVIYQISHKSFQINLKILVWKFKIFLFLERFQEKIPRNIIGRVLKVVCNGIFGCTQTTCWRKFRIILEEFLEESSELFEDEFSMELPGKILEDFFLPEFFNACKEKDLSNWSENSLTNSRRNLRIIFWNSPRMNFWKKSYTFLTVSSEKFQLEFLKKFQNDYSRQYLKKKNTSEERLENFRRNFRRIQQEFS